MRDPRAEHVGPPVSVVLDAVDGEVGRVVAAAEAAGDDLDRLVVVRAGRDQLSVVPRQLDQDVLGLAVLGVDPEGAEIGAR
ncbi:hypothetical protein BBK82_23030 [Lentzea guizhouensis]|uniref:Uncharacterized protein n=1 Tax=Lentzea guizhouensis TaxID=1586287 RepID=A0A1B2HLC2_9PSEU|nr:hypothetical protein BBK82_23030 [Lentzea guizhouensis]